MHTSDSISASLDPFGSPIKFLQEGNPVHPKNKLCLLLLALSLIFPVPHFSHLVTYCATLGLFYLSSSKYA